MGTKVAVKSATQVTDSGPGLRLVRWLSLVLVIMLLARLALKILGANPFQTGVFFLYILTDIFVMTFREIVVTLTVTNSRLVLDIMSTLLTTLAFGLLAYPLVRHLLAKVKRSKLNLPPKSLPTRVLAK